MKYLLILLILVGLNSCKKEFTCVCKGHNSTFKGNEQTSFTPYKRNYTIKSTKNKAACKSYVNEVDYYTYRTLEVENCELK